MYRQINIATILLLVIISLPLTAAESETITEYPGAGEIILTTTLTLGAMAIDMWGHSSNVTPGEPADSLDYRINSHFGKPSRAVGITADVFYWSTFTVPVACYGMQFIFGPENQRPLRARIILTWWQGFAAAYFTTQAAKVTIRRPRPNGKDTGSFFSGHSSITFYSAAYFSAYLGNFISSRIENEAGAILLGYVLTPVLLYGAAGFTAFSRVRNHHHYFSDVVVGSIAGTSIGLLTWYFLFPENAKKGRKFTLLPLFSPRMNGLALQYSF